MSFAHLGETRSARRQDHLLQTPDTFVRTVLPGMKQATAIVHTNPGMGAAFTQYTAEMESGGALGYTGAQRFLYVLDGVVNVTGKSINRDGYCFIPEGDQRDVEAEASSRVAVLEKRYVPALEEGRPTFFVGQESDIAAQPLSGDTAVSVRCLLPESVAHDFAVNTMTYEPGASLSMVEIHVMEHGLLMLEGGGIYRLADYWYPVSAGDFIWMAPYCPQWFGAIGKTPAKYLIYKDWNRHPL